MMYGLYLQQNGLGALRIDVNKTVACQQSGGKLFLRSNEPPAPESRATPAAPAATPHVRLLEPADIEVPDSIKTVEVSSRHKLLPFV